ncbi:FAD-binding oxidoreductase [Actinocatenispora rupis]|uniref:Oxidoreductase n=1 Tax=Actinocatenispora rupis TaxID=519421 RepID=A0A8J3J4K9_9ACTN|nr:FAD-binding oxidoreductase [Actinocatenispora rupis]GID10032.1 oxidoreductase [Actinocatenispora rupis]
MIGRLDGEVLTPGDTGYDELRRTFVHAGRPALVVRCRGAGDVAAALDHARTEGLTVSVRGGGHHTAGFATNDGGIVLDLSYLDGVEVVDPARRLVRIGGGATWGRVSKTLAGYGLALSSGDTANVGVGGLLLGGGIGWLTRRYGLALDAVVAADVVLADGTPVRASATQHQDLYWALRGGGGNLGVVTAFELVAQPVTDVVYGTVRYPGERAADVLRHWARHAAAAPDELTSAVDLAPGDGPAMLSVCYAGGDPAAAETAVRPLRPDVPELGDDLRPVPYPEILAELPGLPPGFRMAVRSTFVREFTPALIEALVAASAAPMVAVNVRALGGAVDRVAPDATAFAHRGHAALVTAVAMGDELAVAHGEPLLDELMRRIDPYVTGAYPNFASTDRPADVAAMYPAATRRRLAAVKRTYDPGNVFRRNYNITPAD